MRINARLDDEHTRKVEYLRAATGRTLTEVVKDAIDHYHAEVAAGSGRASAVLARTGFIGCGEADADLSADYKRRLSDSLDAKHDHR
jgi:predicted transcriptional regulator